MGVPIGGAPYACMGLICEVFIIFAMWRAQFLSVTMDRWFVGGFSLWLLAGAVSVTKSAGFLPG